MGIGIPAASVNISGFGTLTLDNPVTPTYATSDKVIGKIYASDYNDVYPFSVFNGVTDPVTAPGVVSDFNAAYAEGMGRSAGTGDFLLNSSNTACYDPGPGDTCIIGAAGHGSGIFTPGVYTVDMGTGDKLTIYDNITLSGGADDVWIFQVPGTLKIYPGKKIILTGGARFSNVFWVVGASAKIGNSGDGTGVIFEGNILAAGGIDIMNGATLYGRALASGGITLKNSIVSAYSNISSLSDTVPSAIKGANITSLGVPDMPPTEIGSVTLTEEQAEATSGTLFNTTDIGATVLIKKFPYAHREFSYIMDGHNFDDAPIYNDATDTITNGDRFVIVVEAEDGLESSMSIYAVDVTVNQSSPTLENPAISNITKTSATFSADITSDGGANITKRGAYYILYANGGNPPTHIIHTVYELGTDLGNGTFSVTATGLACGTHYNYIPTAKNSSGLGGYVIGSVEGFWTLACDALPGTTTKNVDLQTASPFGILSKTGIVATDTSGSSQVNGDMGIKSTNGSADISGFSLTLDNEVTPTAAFSGKVSGKVYA
ncbi:MAG: ice-binding family protein, partial [archaeon]